MNLLGAHQVDTCWKRFISLQEVDGGIDAIFLFGWGGGVIARIPPVPAVGGRSWMASGANRSPSWERTSPKWHGLANLTRTCKLKNLALGQPANSTLVRGKPAPGVLSRQYSHRVPARML